MRIEAHRSVSTADTMRGGTGTNAQGMARVHGVLLNDPGSCELPIKNQTITLAEWWAQQKEEGEE